MLSTILRKHLKANHLISSLGLNIYWLHRLICWLLNKCITYVLDRVSSPEALLNLYRAWHCKSITKPLTRNHMSVTLRHAMDILSCLVPGKTTWSSQVGNCSRRRPGVSCPAHGGLGLGRAPHQSTRLYLCLWWGKTRVGKGQKCKGEEEPDEEPQKKERLEVFLHCARQPEKQRGRWSLLAASTGGEAGVSRGAGELPQGREDAGWAAWPTRVAHCLGYERVRRLPSKPTTQHLSPWSSTQCLLPILPSPFTGNRSCMW